VQGMLAKDEFDLRVSQAGTYVRSIEVVFYGNREPKRTKTLKSRRTR
jgi:hypothetical protein